jgi:macrolide-specific efflux system membrane fusion protein
MSALTLRGLRQLMKLNKRTRLLLLAGCLIVAGLVIKWSFFSTAPVSPYLTATVTVGDIEDSVLASGTIKAQKQVSVGSQASGQLKRLYVTLGQRVKQGQLIAEIDSLTQQNALQSAEAAQRDARAQLLAKQATLAQAELTFKRQQTLVAQDAASVADFETAQSALRVARAAVTQLTAQVAEAALTEDSARVSLGYTRILAPMDGTVVAVVSKEGQTVNASQSAPTIVMLARLDTVTVKTEISEADIVRVKVGQPAYFTILGAPERRFTSVVRSIEPAPDSITDDDTGSSTTTSSTSSSSTTAIYYNGLLDVANPDGMLRISMTTQVHILLAAAHQVLIIPASTLGARQSDGGYRVQVLNAKGQPEWRSIRIGLNNHVMAQVSTGLKAGEQVVIGASNGVSSTQTRNGPPPGMM